MTIRSRENIPDLLKGTALVLMIQVHIMELFALPAIYQSWVGKLSLFLGGPPVAPVFVGIMGYFAVRSQKTARSLIRRGIFLFGLGLLLNVARATHVLVKIRLGVFDLDPWQYVLGVDILHVAGLSLILIAFVRPLLTKHPAPAFVAAVGIAMLTPAVNTVVATEGPAKWLFAFVAGDYEWSYFPLFPWLAYPLLGVAVGAWRDMHQGESAAGERWSNPARADMVVLAIGLVVNAFTWPRAVAVAHDLPSYYHHDESFFYWMVVFLATWCLIHAIVERWLGRMLVARWLKWMGRHVTIVYVWQWLIIGNVATAVFRELTLQQCVIWFLVVLTATNVFIVVTVAVWSRIRPVRTTTD